MSGVVSNSPQRLCEVRWPGVSFAVKDQDISRLTTWRLASPAHIAVVHLNGPIHRLETELAGVGSLLQPPMNGEVWVVPGGMPYASLARGGNVRYAELFFDPSAFPELAADGIAPLSIRPCAGHYDDHFYRTVLRLQTLVRQPGDLARMEAETLSRALSLHFFREYSAANVPRLRARPRPALLPKESRLLQEYISTHLAQPIRLAGLASLVGHSVHELLARFRETFGGTPAQYIIEQRLRSARSLLLRSSHDITTIALETGFSSHAHFTTAFKSRVGLTPQEFRRHRSQ